MQAQEVLNEAHKHHMAGDFPTAEMLYCKLISHAEEHPAAYFALGTLYAQMHAHGRAITFLKRAIDMVPHANGAMENLAAVYREMEDSEKARYWGEKALAIEETPIALSNMSGTFINNATPDLALEWAEKAIARKALPQALNHKAIALLELGRYEEGWAIYDSRLDLPNFHRRPYTCPLWDGKDVGRLAIHGEQGLGDEILFLTCLKQLRGRFREYAIECSPRLVKLIQSSFPDAKVFGTHDELVKGFRPNAYVPMGTLPRMCWPVVPNTYLKADSVKTGRIGISWRGGSVSTHMRLRNTEASAWKTFKDLGELVSLQYGPADHEEIGIPHDAEAIADLERLAALIKSCALVITVCNTTVHMAGALGVPCLVLVPSKPAWRYGLTGERMVWYESPVMLRQAEGESWESVFERAKSRAREMLGADNRRLSEPQSAAA